MDWTSPFIIGPLCMGAGVFAGMLLMRLLDGKKNDAKALAALRDEFDDYRTNVNEHFEQTSELFQGMTEKYRDVYNHLAAGAQQFGNSDESPPRLEIVQPAAQLAAETANDSRSAEDTVAEAAEEPGSAGGPDSKPEATDNAAGEIDTATAGTHVAEADSDSKADDNVSKRDAFALSAPDESALADLVEADSELVPVGTQAQATEQPVRVARNTFRNMPTGDEQPATAGPGTGKATGKVNGKAEAAARKEPATQA